MEDVAIPDLNFLVSIFSLEFIVLWFLLSPFSFKEMRSPVKLNRMAASSMETSQHHERNFEKQTEWIRWLIWLYMILWITEGGLRRWFLPGLATPLLLIRDPVVIAIYYVAATKNLFPKNGFMLTGVALAFLTLVNALVVGHGNLSVALYGVRCDFLHVPLFFIMARVLRQKHLLAFARIAVVIAVPYTALLIAQFYAPQDAWVNRGVGGEGSAGFDGALDRFRPPGTFSFITGTAQLYTLFTAFWFALLLARKAPNWLLISSGLAIVVAVPISVSRGLFLSVSMVAVAGVVALFAGGRLSPKIIVQSLVVALVLPFFAHKIPAFKDGLEAFGSRWESATDEQGGVKVAIMDRVLDGLTEPFKGVGFSGLGTGFSTNVGQKLLTQETGFGASEGEWGRLLFDNGFLLGSLLVGYRIGLALLVASAAMGAWRARSPFAFIFMAAAFVPIFMGQWGQASSLGGTVIEAGLALAAAQIVGGPAVSFSQTPDPPRRTRRPTRTTGARPVSSHVVS